MLAAGAAALLLTAPAPALASPADDVAAAQAAEQELMAEVGRIQGEVTAAEEQLQRMTVEAEAAADAALVAQAELAAAQEAAAVAAAELQAARDAVAAAQDEVVELGREAYMGASVDMGDAASVLLDSEGPREVLERAATLDLLGTQRAETLQEYELLETQEEQADAAAQAAVVERDAAAAAAAEAQAAADARLADAQSDYDALAAAKAQLDEQLRAAEVELLRLRGIADAEAAWQAQQEAEQAAAVNVRSTGGGIAPTTGRVTSCYGARWGTMHYGVDIAAPIGTPIFAPDGGVVLQAGPASGFGQAVYVQHGDGSITLYGHVDQFFVSAGQVVSAGQQIAEVGNKGQSTGPHLHFEVHEGGLYASRVNPMPWLEGHGISLGGGC
ncbi:Murein DD-endopeptidase MepM and murein hydrolase activator NlpD, contain LysM domain [Geodermatophilus amargosae]|uniref:Murein DD-endopeptidase MepM and murein hydrolase activator NlpD, contain LysM domain n=1 Tax=Geodermatophilus amargosae TaxID=1296565 RepID=A0A1I7CRL2_9ACTN|nr:M23 family metallopeptidase [Geodermatophilus amargosae]SFU02090.1 Murein DD-endopeptidase MepM and murein hydrolase activator NlpD, contain LysM domain [Geodermatophilus amargosae]